MSLHLVTGYKGESHITPSDAGALNAGLFGVGDYVMETGNKFAAYVLSNNTIRILDGDLIMQGRHITLKKDTYEDITINNGTIGKNRNDLIVVRYTLDTVSGVENAEFAVIQGEETAGTAADPEHTTGDILSGGCTLHEMPLYRIQISEFTVGEPVKLFQIEGKVSKSGDTMTGSLILKRMFGETAETGSVFPSAYTIGADRTFAITRQVNEITESMLFFNKNGLGLFDAMNEEYSYFARVVSGSYTGDGKESQFINLGFTPSAVIVVTSEGQIGRHNGNDLYCGGIAMPNKSCAVWSNNKDIPVISVENNGFRVYLGEKAYSNANSNYYYIAYR